MVYGVCCVVCGVCVCVSTMSEGVCVRARYGAPGAAMVEWDSARRGGLGAGGMRSVGGPELTACAQAMFVSASQPAGLVASLAARLPACPPASPPARQPASPSPRPLPRPHARDYDAHLHSEGPVGPIPPPRALSLLRPLPATTAKYCHCCCCHAHAHARRVCARLRLRPRPRVFALPRSLPTCLCRPSWCAHRGTRHSSESPRIAST